jgi:hypothetical protein
MNRSQRFGLCAALVCLLAVFLPVRPVAAGDKEDWKPIDPADLALKDNPASPGANAMILYREAFVNEKYASTDGSYIYNYYRIKIFTQKGADDQADVEIPFFKDTSDIKDIHARTIKPDGSIVNFEGKPFEKTIVKQSGEKYLAKTLTLPDVKPGCIVEYKYRVQYQKEALYDENWVLSSDLFTREGNFSILPYQSNYQNFPLFFRQFGLKETMTPQKQTDGTYTLTVKNIDAVWDEINMPPARTIEARIEFYHKNQDTPLNETQDQFWTRTQKNWVSDYEHFIGKKKDMEAEVAKTVAASDTPEQKLRKLYVRAQQIRNLNDEDSKSEKEAKQENLKKNNNTKDVLEHGYAGGRSINLFFVALARAAGFDAYPVLVAPRNYATFFPQIQDPSALRADIVWVKAGDKEYWLDPAVHEFPFGILPWYETNTPGVRISSKLPDMITSPEPKLDDAVITRTADVTLDADGNAEAKVSVDFSGQIAAMWREDYRKDDETAHKKAVEDRVKEWMPSNGSFELTKLDNWDKTDMPLHAEGTVKFSNLSSTAGHRMLVPSTIFVPPQTKIFESALRHNAVCFHYPYKEVDTIKYTAPPSFKVETVPDKRGTNPASVVAYSMEATHDGSTAQVKRSLTINALVVDVKYYTAMRNFFNTVKNNDASQIVLQTSETAKN